MKSILSTFLAIFVVITQVHAYEDGNKGYCQNAETTADLMECIGTRYDNEILRMNSLYDELINTADDIEGYVASLQANQNNWISYRDEICDLSGRIYEGGSLQRIETISCMARITSERSDHFENMLSAFDTSKIPVYASPPRWTNALIHDYPDIFWAFGQAKDADMDCDGIDEKVVIGLQQMPTDKTMQKYMAIADSEKTGRPNIFLKPFDLEESCTPTMIPLFTKSKTEEPSCRFIVQTDSENCNEIMIEFDAEQSNYAFIDEYNADNKKEQPE
jgi:uncharacterized protein YecT (DUF1311 family)